MSVPSSTAAASPLLLPVLFLGVLMGAVDIAIVGPALPAIGATYGADESALAWVFSIFTLFAVISAAPLARFSDRYGRRRIYALSLGIFTLGSLLVAVSPSFEWLIAARGVQAVGAGGIFPVASAVIGDVVPEDRRGRALGMIGAVFGIAFLLGPLLGGLLLPLGWRSLFLVNLPVGVALIALAWRILPGPGTHTRAGIDWRGMGLLAVLLLSLAIGFNRIAGIAGGEWVDFAAVGVPLILAGVLARVLARVERAAAEPVIPPGMFASGQLRLIGTLAIVAGFVEAGMVFLPSVAVAGLGVTEAQAAWMMLPLVVALVIVAPLAGAAVDRWNARFVIRAGLLILLAGVAVFALLPIALFSFYAAGCLIGAGLAALLGAPLRHAALSAAPAEHRGIGQGLMSLALHTGQIAGAAAIGAFMAAETAAASGFRAAMFWLACLVVLACALSTRLR